MHITHAYNLIFLGNPIIADFGSLKPTLYLLQVDGFELKVPGVPQEQHDHGNVQEVLNLQNYTHGTYYMAHVYGHIF